MYFLQKFFRKNHILHCHIYLCMILDVHMPEIIKLMNGCLNLDIIIQRSLNSDFHSLENWGIIPLRKLASLFIASHQPTDISLNEILTQFQIFKKRAYLLINEGVLRQSYELSKQVLSQQLKIRNWSESHELIRLFYTIPDLYNGIGSHSNVYQA